MESHKIQICSRTDIAMGSKLLFFGNLYGYKRNLTQNYQNLYKFYVILKIKSKKFVIFIRILYTRGTDPDPFGQKSTDPDPGNPTFVKDNQIKRFKKIGLNKNFLSLNV